MACYSEGRTDMFEVMDDFFGGNLPQRNLRQVVKMMEGEIKTWREQTARKLSL
jgi:hypothetical protein